MSAIGIVYGDIGTSPLYALKECFNPEHFVELSRSNVLGVLSLVFWTITIIVTVKYHILIMRADNDGEGGILALMQLVKPKKKGTGYIVILGLGLFGASLLYGDGIITPAISVLSAVEGLNVATSFFNPYIIPITLVVLFFLFFFQKKGTGGIGRIFGPIMVLWFLTLILLGLPYIIKNPDVLHALNPYYAFEFFRHNGFTAFVILGAVFLVATGGEALYADMGHFNHKSINIAWFNLVFPSLLINYFGQGALLLQKPGAIENPFYYLAPGWALYPLVILSTIATIIASQAVISGAFSLTQQALNLGFLPRVKIMHTSSVERGQIYIPSLNWLLFIAIVILVLGFKTSSELAGAYGVAITTTMAITTMLAYVVERKLWKWNIFAALAVTVFFLTIDLSFWGANLLKIFEGGWVPLAMGAIIYLFMTTWNWGRQKLLEKVQEQTHSIETFITEFLSIRVMTISGTAIYMSSNPHGIPPSLIHNLKHNKVLHKQIIVLTILFEKLPHLTLEEKIEIENPTEGFYKIISRYGFMDTANIVDVIAALNKKGIKIKIDNTTFFLGRESIFVKKGTGLPGLRKRLFILMSHNAQRATEFFNIPPNRVFEIGSQIEI